MGLLINNMVLAAIENDKRNHMQGTDTCFKDNFVKIVRACGVSFDIWETRNADGRGSGDYTFTSLTGDNIKKILYRLPCLLSEENAPKVKFITQEII